MPSLSTVEIIALSYLFARLCAWGILKGILWQLDAVIKECEAIIAKHGQTNGDLQRAGVYDHMQSLYRKGGWSYVAGVPFAAFLLWWPIGPLLMGERIRQTNAEVGQWIGPNQAGSHHIAQDLQRGFAKFSNYYHTQLLKGSAGVLKMAKLLF